MEECENTVTCIHNLLKPFFIVEFFIPGLPHTPFLLEQKNLAEACYHIYELLGNDNTTFKHWNVIHFGIGGFLFMLQIMNSFWKFQSRQMVIIYRNWEKGETIILVRINQPNIDKIQFRWNLYNNVFHIQFILWLSIFGWSQYGI